MNKTCRALPLDTQVTAALRRLISRHSPQLRWQVRESTVYLEGAVPTYYLKQLALQAVWRITEVRAVVNRIEVV